MGHTRVCLLPKETKVLKLLEECIRRAISINGILPGAREFENHNVIHRVPIVLIAQDHALEFILFAGVVLGRQKQSKAVARVSGESCSESEIC
jgi:hypothetical protein